MSLIIPSSGPAGTDTSDATVTSGSQILQGYTAYSNDVKYTGTFSLADATAGTATADKILSGFTAWVNGSMLTGTANPSSKVLIWNYRDTGVRNGSIVYNTTDITVNYRMYQFNWTISRLASKANLIAYCQYDNTDKAWVLNFSTITTTSVTSNIGSSVMILID